MELYFHDLFAEVNFLDLIVSINFLSFYHFLNALGGNFCRKSLFYSLLDNLLFIFDHFNLLFLLFFLEKLTNSAQTHIRRKYMLEFPNLFKPITLLTFTSRYIPISISILLLQLLLRLLLKSNPHELQQLHPARHHLLINPCHHCFKLGDLTHQDCHKRCPFPSQNGSWCPTPIFDQLGLDPRSPVHLASSLPD